MKGDSDDQGYQRPPVVFQQKAAPARDCQAPILALPNIFEESKVEVDGNNSIECLEFLSQGTFLAAGCSNGAIRVLSSAQGTTQYVLKADDSSPITGLAHNPNKSSIRHAVLATHSQGTLEYWHATSRQLLFSKKFDQMLQTCQINPSGTHYAFSGDQGKIRLGHLNKQQPQQVLVGHLGNHDNRVFCLKWNPLDNNMLLSGGWDKAVHFWDLRSKCSSHKLFGYYIGGQAIDFRGHQILLGNNTPEFPLRIYDMKADKVRSLQWVLTQQSQRNFTTGVLSCFFVNEDQIVACSPKNQVRVLSHQRSKGNYVNKQQDNKLYCMQHFAQEQKVVTGWSDGSIRWLSYQ